MVYYIHVKAYHAMFYTMPVLCNFALVSVILVKFTKYCVLYNGIPVRGTVKLRYLELDGTV